ncbi:hypothetical protein K437DRAFT_56713 [Tilletiaria anomala UBC 951]|uniref:Rhodanese domain-containing protein n=1 Tax=Tilletiaria anomala (strain ATCC 24038 / CBS 436.72 / UBC 951) TaxID=1037660 RepID=A0A066WCC2_TILAU|nr:uncharacterized protein K437DRAFT_56713 [Tilletiaria anomala UBC 951]KDN51366.1 hypothetical protein K437DRAFT_56713 [Tilletiaria anomala UBC 951]
MASSDRRASRLRVLTTRDDEDDGAELASLRILLPFLALVPSERLVLDLRSSPDDFARLHVRHSTYIQGLDNLDQRYSTLPPRHVAFLIVCDAGDESKIRETFGGRRRNVLGVVLCGGKEHQGDIPGTKMFWDLAEALKLTQTCSVDQLASRRLANPLDRPFLLGKPAPVVVRAAEWAECLRVDARPRETNAKGMKRERLRALDLGCGAGRDIAWLGWSRSTERGRAITWSVRGVDNLKPALQRAWLLMQDFGLSPPSSLPLPTGDGDNSRAAEAHARKCEGLLWAEVTREGTLNALSGSGRGPRKATRLDACSSSSLQKQEKETTSAAPLFPTAQGGSSRLSALPLDHSFRLESQQRLLERHAALADFARAHLSSEAAARATATFDLLVLVRFLPRQLLLALPALTHVGSLVVVSHFFHVGDGMAAIPKGVRADYENPPVDARIKSGDMLCLKHVWEQLPARDHSSTARAQAQEMQQQWDILEQVIEPIEDGRPVQSTIFRRLR